MRQSGRSKCRVGIKADVWKEKCCSQSVSQFKEITEAAGNYEQNEANTPAAVDGMLSFFLVILFSCGFHAELIIMTFSPVFYSDYHHHISSTYFH